MERRTAFWLVVLMILTAWENMAQAGKRLPVAAQIWLAGQWELCEFEGRPLIGVKCAVSRVDITNDGKPDILIDGDKLTCPDGRRFLCGASDCKLVVFINGRWRREFAQQGWEIEKISGINVLSLSVPGSFCDGDPTMPCVRYAFWDRKKGKFRFFTEQE